MKRWFTPAEIAEMALPELPTTRRGIAKLALRDAWQGRKRAGRGGGFEYPLEALPAAAREAILRRHLNATATAVAKTQPPEPPQAAEDLKDWQRRVMEARATILSEIDRLTLITSRNQAVKTIIAAARRGELRPDLMAMVEAANAKSGAGRTLSRGRIYEWLRLREVHGVEGLAPRPAATKGVPEWASYLMELYGRPQKPSLAFCVERLQADAPAKAPSYTQAARFIRNLDAITRHQGRMGPRDLKRLKAFVRRDTSELWPTAVYSADGHTFDAEVAHPLHGKPFRPEITTVIDIFTRRVVGWSVALAEATWATMDAIRHAFETSGICTIWYVDRGKGFNNAVFDADITGFLGRFGVTKQNSLPYNSQARGIIERVHQSLWVRAAKTLPTYMGDAMDGEARNRAFKITRRDIKATGQSRLLMPWADFMTWCGTQVLAYNQRPHSSLPKKRSYLEGRWEHMSPNDLWGQCFSDGSFTPDLVDPSQSDLFRPYMMRQATRAEVKLFGNTYFAPELEAYHGEQVLVGYDIHNAEKVWVRDKEHRLICVATFGGNRRSYFPVSAMDQAKERRAQGRLLRLVEKEREVQEELNPDAFLEAVNKPLTLEEIEIGDAVYAEIEARSAEEEEKPATHLTLVDGRPEFNSEFEWAQWLALHPDQAEDLDRDFLEQWLRIPSFVRFLQVNRVDVAVLKEIRTPKPLKQQE